MTRLGALRRWVATRLADFDAFRALMISVQPARAGAFDEQEAALRPAFERLGRRVECPTLVLRGGRSDIFSDEDAERFAEALPDGRWRRVEDAGHTIQGDNPRGLVAELKPFLDQVLSKEERV